MRVRLIKTTKPEEDETVELTPEQAAKCADAWPEILLKDGIFYAVEDWNSNIEAVYARISGVAI